MTSHLAARTSAATPTDVFDLLSDLDRHRDLTSARMRIRSLEGPPGARTGAVVDLHGPAGLRRLTHTSIGGEKHAGTRWCITPRG
jgi:hypothetical protein